MHKNGRAKKMNKISQERLDRGRVCNFETCKDSMKDCTESLTFHLCNIAFLLNKPKWFNSTFLLRAFARPKYFRRSLLRYEHRAHPAELRFQLQV